MKVSTKTIIAVTNTEFKLTTLFRYLPITEYIIVKKKRGRKNYSEQINYNQDVKSGSIISLRNKTNHRGAVLKAGQKESKTYFLNSVTVVIYLQEKKHINIKISHNGKLQITGCKDDTQLEFVVRSLYLHISEAERWSGEHIISFISKEETNPKIISKVVMKNLDFKLGFQIDREALDRFFVERQSSSDSDFFSLYDARYNTGVSIKIKSPNPYDDILTRIDILSPLKTEMKSVSHEEYNKYADASELKREQRKLKYITFLVFSSGSVIMSGRGKCMKQVYEDFINLMVSNKAQFEEKLI